MKKIILATVLSLTSQITLALPVCPVLTVEGSCINGFWRMNRDINKPGWHIQGDALSNVACEPTDRASESQWLDAFIFKKLKVGGCHYQIFDENKKLVGKISLEGPYREIAGDHWVDRHFWGWYECTKGRLECHFDG